MKRFKAFLTLAVLFTTAQAFTPSEALGDVPQLIGLQGALKDSSGNPVAGTNSVIFKIYTASTGGSILWTETQSVTTNSQGVFSVLLGAAIPIPDSVFRDTVAFLAVKVGSDPEMTPRQRLVSVGYAFGIPNLRVHGDTIILADRVGGSVGIATATTRNKLDVEGNVAIGAAFSGDNAAPANGLVIEGNVGIGTASPVSPFTFDKTLVLKAGGLGPSIGLKDTSLGGQHFEIASTVDVGGQNARMDFYCPTSATPIASFRSNCNVGIGTKTPSQRFEVVGNAKVSDTVFAGAFSSTSPLKLQTNGTTRIYVDDVTGKVGIGLTNPTSTLDVFGGLSVGSNVGTAGNIDLYYRRQNNPNLIASLQNSGDASGLKIQAEGNSLGSGDITFYTGDVSATERMRIKYNGNVGIGGAPGGVALDVVGTIRASVGCICPSDIRLKKNIAPLSNVLNRLQNIRGVTFEWNDQYVSTGRATSAKQIGVIAQELEKEFPELVAKPDGDYAAVDYSKFSAVLLEAIKEQQKEIEELKNRILKLEKSSPQVRVEE